MSCLRFIPVVVLASTAAHAAEVDVHAILRTEINNNAAAKSAALKALHIKEPAGWTITRVKVKLKAPDVKFTLPGHKLEALAVDEIVNCEDTAVTRTITMSKEVTNSISITKTHTVAVGAEVSGTIQGVGAKGTFNYSFSRAKADTETTARKVEEATTIAFDKRGGRISVLQSQVLQAKDIPWSADFVPDPSQPIELAAEGSGKVCIYEHADYRGKHQCFDAPAEVSRLERAWNNTVSSFKITGPVSLRIWQFGGFNGKSRHFIKDVPNIGADWNDRVSALKVERDTREKAVPFAQIQASLPPKARTFTASGTITVADTKPEGKRIVNYAVPEADVQKICAKPPALGVAGDAKSVKAAGGVGAALVRRALPLDEAMRRIATAKQM